jgi:mannose-6-phosphate isomerase-like protein (cupin superfamily)
MKKKKELPNNTVIVTPTAPVLPDGVINISKIKPVSMPGSQVFVHYNGPTDQLSGACAGMAILAPGASPHEPHRHPEEEFMIVAEGTGVIQCGGKTTKVGPGAMMYAASNTLHGITNTGKNPMTFYWSKWMAKGCEPA